MKTCLARPVKQYQNLATLIEMVLHPKRQYIIRTGYIIYPKTYKLNCATEYEKS